jgi:hypothetical protein
MRTTLSIDDDLLERLKREADRTGTSLRAMVNHMLRLGMERMHPETVATPYQCPTFSMGFPPRDNLDKALQLAAALEDEESVHKLLLRK